MHHKFLDQYSELDSFLHRLDPRVKVIAFTGIILFVVFTPVFSLPPLFSYYALVLILAAFSRVPPRFIIARSAEILPFAAVIALSLFLPRPEHGLTVFAFFLAKAYLAILSMIILVATTPFADLLKAFEKMRCPHLFLMIFSFLYRYLYLVIDEFMMMNQAKESRTMGAAGKPWFKIKTYSNMVGNLLVRSYERGEDVYLAMCARGYEGKIKTLHRFALQRRDYIFLIVVFSCLIAIKTFCPPYAQGH